MTPDSEALLAIERLVHTYSWAASRGNLDALISTFTADGVLAGFAKMVGRSEDEIVGQAAIREMFAGFLPGIEFIHQMSQVGSVTVSGESAQAESMVFECVRWRGQDTAIFMGYYADTLVLSTAGWRFKKRSLQPRAVLQPKGEIAVF